jgi:hypothetical protein
MNMDEVRLDPLDGGEQRAMMNRHVGGKRRCRRLIL